MEITDLNNIYTKNKKINYVLLKKSSVWFDAGTTDSLLFASQYIQAVQERNNMLISSPEEIAYKKGFISKNEFKILLNKMPQNYYSTILHNILKS